MPDDLLERWFSLETEEQRKARARREARRRFFKLVRRIVLAAGSIAAIALAIYGTIKRPHPVLSGITPLVLAFGVLVAVRTGYLAIRELRWRLIGSKKEAAEKA